MIGRNVPCSVVITLVLLLVCTGQLTAQFEYPQPIKPGVHPRLLFGPDDIPAIRRRAATPRGRVMLARLRRSVYGHRDANLKNLKKQDPEWLASTRQDIKRGLLSKWGRQTRYAGLLYTATGNAQDGWIGAEMFRLWLSTRPEPGKIEPEVSWGNAEMAMAYDMLYHLLTPEERRHAVAVFASMTAEPTRKSFFTEWSLDGPRISNRKSCNWTPIRTSSLGLTCQVIEGQPGYNPEVARLSLKLMKAFLLEGISADGGMFEGVIYPLGYGCDRTPYYIISTRRRGVDLTKDTHVLEAPKWFAYETLPWGYESQAFNKSTGQYSGGTFPTFLGQEAGATGEWLFRNCRGWHPIQGQADETMQLIGGIVHTRPVRPDHLPPSHWFSAVGRVVCRSGWGPRDAHFTFNTNPLGAGHTNADQGHFTFASHGVNFIPDSGVHDYASSSHNLVHIDGVGQSEHEGALEAFIRFAELTGYADVVDADLKLAYDRMVVGPFNGPWHWVEYNPVQRADRRTLFVRGATGPLVVVTDDIKKDDQVREYDFLARTTRNNNLLVDGRSFTIAERFGGRYMHTVGPGKVATLMRDKIPGGTYRGWILVRGEPYPRQWSNTTVTINGKALPYNTTYFALGNYDAGWYWNPILPKGPKTEPPFELPEGKLEIRFDSKTGGQVAAVVLTRNKDWQPGYALPADGGDMVVLTMDDLVQGDDPWQVSRDPKSLLDGLFLGAEAPTLSIGENPATRQHVLHAKRNVAGTRFACVMAPRDQDEGKTLQPDPAGSSQVAMVKRDRAVDYVAASVDGKLTTGDVVTDAHAAVVSMERLPQLRWMTGFAVAQGTTLAYRGGVLVDSAVPVTVVNDRSSLHVRGPGGAEVTCRQLDATRLVVNGTETAMPAAEKSLVKVTIPKRPDRWTVDISADGQVVRVDGDGPLPLVVKAPGAVRCLVNGVDRWFVKSSNGDIYPLLETGTTLFEYAGQRSAAELAKLTDDAVTMTTVPGEKRRAMKLTDQTIFDLSSVSPGKYNLTLNLAAPDGATLAMRLGESTHTVKVPPTRGRGFRGVRMMNVGITAGSNKLVLEPTGEVYLDHLVPSAVPQLIEAVKWSIIGGFPSPWPEAGTEGVKTGLHTVYPPEKEIDLDASYEGTDGKKVTWQPCKPAEVIRRDLDKGVTFKQIGVNKGQIAYAVVFITSPTERDAELRIGTDWWARAWVNDNEVKTERPADLVKTDGAQFNAESTPAATVHLKKGINVLLVKNHGGSGGNRFFAYITDPGDLQFSPTR